MPSLTDYIISQENSTDNKINAVIMGLESVRGKVCHGENWLWERKKIQE